MEDAIRESERLNSEAIGLLHEIRNEDIAKVISKAGPIHFGDGASTASGDVGPKELAAHILPLITDPDADTRCNVAEMVIKLDGDIAPSIFPLLNDPDPGVRFYVCEVLCGAGDVRAVGPLADVLEMDSDSAVRANAATALGRLGDPAALGPLTQAARVDNGDYQGWQVRDLAIDAIAEILALHRHEGELLAMLDEPDPLARATALRALMVDRGAPGRMRQGLRDPGVIPRLVALLCEDPAIQVRSAAAKVLARLGDRSALSALREIHHRELDETPEAQRLKEEIGEAIKVIEMRLSVAR
jgi:HEAT repeat protein